MRRTYLYLFVLFFAACNVRKQHVASLVLENGYYFDGSAFVAFKEIVIDSNKITAINNKQTNTVGERIDIEGRYIIPGLIDGHVHLSGSPAMPYTLCYPGTNAHSSLMCGVTTVIDLFLREDMIKRLKEYADNDVSANATILTSGPILTAPGGHGTEYGVPTHTISSVEEADTITQAAISNGADLIKLVYQAHTGKHSISKEMVEHIVTVAHHNHKKVFAHIDAVRELMDCIDAGVDVIAHLPRDTITDTQLDSIKRSGVVIIPTVTVVQSYYEGHRSGYMSDSLLWKTANKDYLEKFDSTKALTAPYPDAKMINNYRSNLRKCITRKIPILAGTDAGNYAVFYGYSLHNELQQYVNAGMGEAAVLRSATENVHLVFPQAAYGKIKAGYDADMVILNKNPLADIANTKNIYKVIHKGRIAK